MTGDDASRARTQALADALSKVDQGGEGAKALLDTTKALTTRFVMTH